MRPWKFEVGGDVESDMEREREGGRESRDPWSNVEQGNSSPRKRRRVEPRIKKRRRKKKKKSGKREVTKVA